MFERDSETFTRELQRLFGYAIIRLHSDRFISHEFRRRRSGGKMQIANALFRVSVEI